MARHVLKPMPREEVMMAIRECREQLGHTPSLVELMRATEVRQGHVQKHFGFYTRALKPFLTTKDTKEHKGVKPYHGLSRMNADQEKGKTYHGDTEARRRSNPYH